MHTIRTIARRGMLYVLSFVLVAGYPATAMADTQEPTTIDSSQTVAPTETQPVEEEKPPLTYTFDPVYQKWNSEEWQYNPETGTYERPPAPIIIEPDSQTQQLQQTEQSQPESDPEVTDTSEQTVDKTVDTDVTVGTNVDSDATSGDALISENTAAGDALTGDASAVANIMNVVNSTVTTGDNQKVATFTKDIMGDVKGDIVLYPLLLKAMLEGKASQSSSATVNATSDLGINNDVNLVAKSGDATVDSNTAAGDATTGSATAMANVVNILNSMIAAQDSFIGTINIYGSLEGDILIAPDFIPQMLANNGGDAGGDLKVSNQDTATIVNNISAVAESGAASVFGNTAGGDATTGDASSNVVIFNVTGHEIIAKNSLLVFVNVLGKWVGMIVDAPAGSTAAMIGSDVTQNTKHEPDLTINSQSTHGITNTIALNAQSGDAVVSNNTMAGNAVSGQARAMANVANVSGNQFSFAEWFGVLFINVQNNWFGSFGINTHYGDIEQKSAPKPTGPVQFIPTKSQTNQNNTNYKVIDSRSNQRTELTSGTTNNQAVLASSVSTESASPASDEDKAPVSENQPQDYRLWIVAGSVFVVGVSALGIRRLLQL